MQLFVSLCRLCVEPTNLSSKVAQCGRGTLPRVVEERPIQDLCEPRKRFQHKRTLAKFERQGVAMQAQQAEIAALKADSRGKEQRIQLVEALLAQHAKRLESQSVQNGQQQMQINRCSHRSTKSGGGGLQAAFYKLSNRTKADVNFFKADTAKIWARLNQCEANTVPFV